MRRRHVAGVVISLLVVTPLLLGACGHDFDALLAGGAQADAAASEEAGDTAATGNAKCDAQNGADCSSCDPQSCDVTCARGDSCQVSCDAKTCTMHCSGDARCALTCNPTTTTCDLFCEGGMAPRSCSDRTYTCNRACPD